METTVVETVKQNKLKGFLTSLKNVAGTLGRKQEEETISELEMLKIQLNEALDNLYLAQINFNNALPEFVDIANEELTIAQSQADVVIKKIKKITNS